MLKKQSGPRTDQLIIRILRIHPSFRSEKEKKQRANSNLRMNNNKSIEIARFEQKNKRDGVLITFR